MRRINKRQYSYTILLAVSFLAAAGMWKTGLMDKISETENLSDGVYASVENVPQERKPSEKKEGVEERVPVGKNDGKDPGAAAVLVAGQAAGAEAPAAEQPAEAAVPGKGQPAGATDPGKGHPAGMEAPAAGHRAEVPAAGQSPAAEPAAGEPQPVSGPVMGKADTSYFDDALFIGDSRTVGLHEYGDLGNAEVFADSGMSVYKIFKQEFKLSTGEKGTLEELLSKRQFGKIYIMLGINELGYEYEPTVSRYKEMLDRIQELQPDAILYLEANLHITEEKSESSPIYNNENINRINQAVAGMSDGTTSFYLDVNELFDDENGGLSKEYTVDNAHVLGIYYADWVEWILEHAYIRESSGA